MTQRSNVQEIKLEIAAGERHRLDVVLTNAVKDTGSELSRSQIARLVRSEYVRVDDEIITQPSFVPKCGSIVCLVVPDIKRTELVPCSSLKLDIIYEDDDLLVLNKQAGISVHPGAGDAETITIAHGLLAHVGDSLLSIGHPMRPGIVHRLDKDTSGLMMVAKTVRAYTSLIHQFLPPRTVHRSYNALVQRLPKRLPISNVMIPDRVICDETGGNEIIYDGIITLNIRRHPLHRKRMEAIVSGGRPAITRWKVCEEYKYGYLLGLELETGRTHQIRAHLQAYKAPIIGDTVYGFRAQRGPTTVQNALNNIKRHMLHASKLSFLHPVTKELLEFNADLPDDFLQATSILNGNRSRG